MAKKSARKPARSAARKRTASKGKSARRAAPRAAAKPKKESWRPPGTGTVTPNLVFRDAGRAIDFYRDAFGAEELMRMPTPDGKRIWHASIRIGDSILYLNDEVGGGTRAAGPDHRPTVSFMVYVPDCDASFRRATERGCTVTMPLMDMFWGDRIAGVADPFGQQWMFATRTREVSREEARRAGEEWAKQNAPQIAARPRDQGPQDTAPS